MDLKILAVVAVLVSLVGLAVAMPSIYNGVGNMTGHDWNATWHMARNSTRPGFNVTAIQDFNQALISGNYSEAQQLNTEYGVGGPIFSRLNETTFDQLSQMLQLRNELRQELGNSTAGFVRPIMARHGGMMRHHIQNVSG